MKISEIENKIRDWDDKIGIYTFQINYFKKEKTKLLQLLSDERGEIINVKKDDEFEFNSNYSRININKKFFIRSEYPHPIKIKITDTSNKFVNCKVIKGTFNNMQSQNYHKSYIVCISKTTLYTLLNDKSTFGDIINRHKVIEEVLN